MHPMHRCRGQIHGPRPLSCPPLVSFCSSSCVCNADALIDHHSPGKGRQPGKRSHSQPHRANTGITDLPTPSYNIPRDSIWPLPMLSTVVALASALPRDGTLAKKPRSLRTCDQRWSKSSLPSAMGVGGEEPPLPPGGGHAKYPTHVTRTRLVASTGIGHAVSATFAVGCWTGATRALATRSPSQFTIGIRLTRRRLRLSPSRSKGNHLLESEELLDKVHPGCYEVEDMGMSYGVYAQ